MKAAPYRFIHCSKAWFMITGDQQLELRNEFEKILPHEPRGDAIAAAERL